MGVSLVITGSAAAYSATTNLMIGDMSFPIGTVGLVVFVVAVIAGQFYMMNKHRKEEAVEGILMCE